MCSLSLDSSLVPNELVIGWERNVDETGRYGVRKKQNLAKKADAAFQLGWLPFYEGLDL